MGKEGARARVGVDESRPSLPSPVHARCSTRAELNPSPALPHPWGRRSHPWGKGSAREESRAVQNSGTAGGFETGFLDAPLTLCWWPQKTQKDARRYQLPHRSFLRQFCEERQEDGGGEDKGMNPSRKGSEYLFLCPQLPCPPRGVSACPT